MPSFSRGDDFVDIRRGCQKRSGQGKFERKREKAGIACPIHHGRNPAVRKLSSDDVEKGATGVRSDHDLRGGHHFLLAGGKDLLHAVHITISRESHSGKKVLLVMDEMKKEIFETREEVRRILRRKKKDKAVAESKGGLV